MKILIFILILAGFVGLAFSAWGIYTPQGRTKFDEMDGLYPLFCGIVGGILIVSAVTLVAFRLWTASVRG